MALSIIDLISEVSKRPVLWDQKNKDYHNRILVEKTWHDVEAALKAPKDYLKKRWKNVRDQFRNECKKLPDDSADFSEKQYDNYTTWIYFKPLLFLRKQLKPRKSTGNLTISTVAASREQLAQEDVLNEDTLTECYTINSVTESHGETRDNLNFETTTDDEPPVNKKQKTNTHHVTADSILAGIKQKQLNLLEKKINKDQTIKRNDDEDFFNSLQPYFKTMNMKDKLLCRMEIQRTVFKYAFPSSEESISQYLSGNEEHHYEIRSPKIEFITDEIPITYE